MMHVALQQKRISRPVLLKISTQVVSRPGVLFCERNAAAKGITTSPNPNVVKFEVVKKADQFSVQPRFRMFYQGEVLVPELVPAHLIEIPEVDVFNRVLEVVGPDVVLDPLCEETPDDPIDSKEQVAEGIPKVIGGAVQRAMFSTTLVFVFTNPCREH